MMTVSEFDSASNESLLCTWLLASINHHICCMSVIGRALIRYTSWNVKLSSSIAFL